MHNGLRVFATLGNLAQGNQQKRLAWVGGGGAGGGA